MRRKKIFIFDDDIDFVASVKTILEDAGYQIFSAENTHGALEKIEKAAPDLIIMDVMMEKMSDGFELSRKLKSDDRYKRIPIFMLTSIGDKTGFCFSTNINDKAWLPVDGFSEKPVPPDKLIFNVKRLLSD